MRKPEKQIISNLVKQGILQDTSILCVCAGESEAKLFNELGIKNATLTNIDESAIPNSTYKHETQNALNLTYETDSFDYVFVSNGLHHCSSPHRALLEMYRVARKTIIMFECKDSFLIRLAVRFKLTVEYEGVNKIPSCGGGYNGSRIPNYIYRWTEREIEKTICSYYPIGINQFKYTYALDVPESINKILAGFIKVVLALFPKSKNVFCAVVTKPEVNGDLFTWMKNIPDYKDILAGEHKQLMES